MLHRMPVVLKDRPCIDASLMRHWVPHMCQWRPRMRKTNTTCAAACLLCRCPPHAFVHGRCPPACLFALCASICLHVFLHCVHPYASLHVFKHCVHPYACRVPTQRARQEPWVPHVGRASLVRQPFSARTLGPQPGRPHISSHFAGRGLWPLSTLQRRPC